jgi:hypothetical protein
MLNIPVGIPGLYGEITFIILYRFCLSEKIINTEYTNPI